MTARNPALAVALLCSTFAACSGGSSHPGGGIQLVRTIAVSNPFNGNALNGVGDIVGVSYTDVSNAGATSGFRETLLLYRRDAAYPQDLMTLASIYLGVDTLYHRVNDLTLTTDWATVTMNFNDAANDWVAFVALTGPAPALATTLPMTPSLDRAIASGHWGVVVAGMTVTLVDLSTPSTPTIVQTFSSSSAVTSLLPVGDGFLAFTNTGYGHLVVTTASPQWTETLSPDLRQFAKGYVQGTQAYVAGASPFAGKARLARLDISTPALPAMVVETDVDGLYADFGYDGAGRYVLVTQSGYSMTATVCHESGNTIVPSASGSIQTTFRPVSGVYARSGYLYTLADGIALYQLP